MGRFFCEFLLFSRENRLKSADCSVNFDFFPAKIPRNWPIFPRICPWKSCEILLDFPRNIRSPDYVSWINTPRNTPRHEKLTIKTLLCISYVFLCLHRSSQLWLFQSFCLRASSYEPGWPGWPAVTGMNFTWGSYENFILVSKMRKGERSWGQAHTHNSRNKELKHGESQKS